MTKYKRRTTVLLALVALAFGLPLSAQDAKYSPNITLTVGRYQDNNVKFAEGDTWDRNTYTNYYDLKMGITLKNSWAVSQDQWEQKLNIVMASGDLPDLVWAPLKQFNDLVEAGQAADLTAALEKYGTPFTKKVLNMDKTAFGTAIKNGRLMAIPFMSASMDSAPMIWYRSDWAAKLGLKAPKTMADVLAMAKTFATKDPDGNGKKDTIGMGFSKGFLTAAVYKLSGYFAGFHSYPRTWVKDSTGKLTYGSLTAETRAALVRLQQAAKEGLTDPEFGVKDDGKVGEMVAAGKVGLVFGPMWEPLADMNKTILNDKNADWIPVALASNDSKPALAPVTMGVGGYAVVNPKYKNPEAVIKLLNFQIENAYGVTAGQNGIVDNDGDIPKWQYQPLRIELPRKNLDTHLAILDADKRGDPSNLTAEQKGAWDNLQLWKKGDRTGWGFTRVFYTPSSFDIIGYYNDNNVFQYNAFYGAPTATMAERQATLDQLEDETFTKIILGADIKTFDDFAASWKKLGGDKITTEVNDWYKKNK